jgi:hypothetical protein
MTKKINLSLYKSLLHCDFFLLKYNFYKKKSKMDSLITRYKSYNIINLLESIKNIKRFIYILKFILKKKFNNLIIQIENSIFFNLITLFFNIYKNKQSFLLFTNKVNTRTLFETQEQYAYCLLGNSIVHKKKNEQLKKITNNEIYLISKLNLYQNYKEQGIYKINTDFIDFKKFFFFMILINKIINYYFK